MALFEGKTPAERNKTIAAIVLGVFALIFLGRMLFGSSGTTQVAHPTPTPKRQATQSASNGGGDAIDPNVVTTKIRYDGTPVSGSEAGRNIFAFYVPPEIQKPLTGLTPTPPPATPIPTPPLVMAALSPASVYARTNDFALQVAGDKFTPATRVYLDGQEAPTEYKSPQQLIATVPAAIIAAAGPRKVVARTPDNTLFSNEATLNVMQPPIPTYTYVGYIARRRTEAAVLKNQKGDLVTVQANDIIEGRFRVIAVSEHSVDLVDKELSIKHSLPYIDPRTNPTVNGIRPGGSISPPPPTSDEETEEP